jgi:polysaccharide biosynthesis/export protein
MDFHWLKPFQVASQALRRRFYRPVLGDILAICITAGVSLLCLILALFFISNLAIAAPLSPGDRLAVLVSSGEDFSGKFQVDMQGYIQMPYTGPIHVAGMEPEQAANAISDRLVKTALFRADFVRTAVSVIAWAPLTIPVSGAVFYPGTHRINMPIPRDRAPEKQDELPGAALPERRLSDALRTAGGVTPWADVAHVMVRRVGLTQLYNLWGVVRGEPALDPILQAGDEVIVPTLALPQPALARPTSITPPGVKVFVSNLIQPSLSNAQASVNGGSLSFAYGTRLSQGAVAADCVGGVGATNASRAVVLVRTDRQSGLVSTHDIPVERLIRASFEDENPMLMEGDALACYDSKVTNVREVFRSFSDILSPLSIIFKGVRF